MIYGIKKLRKKKLGYANDYCNTCETPSLVEKWRWFNWLHLFWIPIIPLGYRHNWVCTVCEKDANLRMKTDVFRKVLISIALLFLSMIMFQSEVTHKLEYALPLKILTVTFFLASLVWLIKHKAPTKKSEFRKDIQPVKTDYCLYCQNPLSMVDNYRCTSCHTQAFTKID